MNEWVVLLIVLLALFAAISGVAWVVGGWLDDYWRDDDDEHDW